MKKQLFSAFCLLMLCMGMKAQVSAYSFSQSSGTYVPLPATGATTVHGTGWDDAVVAATIPFNFYFNGSTYTSCSVNTNGYLTFGATTSGTTLYTPISGATGYSGAVSAFGRDLLDGLAGAQNPIVCNTIGTAPNRTFVVQWTNAFRYSGARLAGDAYNFQICLHEGGGVAATQSVSIVYGACTTTNTATGVTHQIGLRGAANTDYNNRSTSTDWATTIAGTTNAASCLTTPAINPASGLTFVYSPPPACVAPTAQATGLTFGGITATAVNGTYTAVSTGTAGYLVIRTLGTAPNTPTNGVTYTTGTSAALAGTVVAVGTSTTFATTGLVGNTNYSYYIYAYSINCTGGPLYNPTSPLTGTVLTCPATPGTATVSATTQTAFNLAWGSSVGGGAATVTYTVDVATNNTFASPVAGSPFVVVAPSNSVAVTGLTTGTQYFYRIKADNGCSSAYTSTASVTTLSAPCVAPAAQASGLTFGGITTTVVNGTYTPTSASGYLVIRTLGTAPNTPTNGVTYTTGTSAALAGTVVAVGTSTTFATTGLAGNTNYSYFIYAYNNTGCSGGPVYNVTAPLTGTAVTCPATPGTGTVSAVTTTGFNLAWGSSAGGNGSPVTYTVDVSTSNTFATAVSGSPFVVAGPTTSVSVAGLNASTQYYYRIIAGNGCNSAYTSTATVATSCNAISVLPWNESFEGVGTVGAGVLPICWTYTNIAGSNPPGTAVTGTYRTPRTGVNMLYSQYSNTARVFTPGFQLTAGTSYDFSFYMYNYNALTPFTMDVSYGTANTEAAMTNTLLVAYTPTNTAYALYKYTIIPAATGTYYFGVKSTSSNTTPWYFSFDDFKLELTPTCFPPTALASVGTTTSTATFTWTAPATGTPANYQYEVRTSGAAGSGTTGLATTGTITVPTTSAQATGLAAGAGYSVYVRSDCGAGDFSAWSNATGFSTACAALNIPYVMNFNSAVAPAMPVCTSNLNAGTGNNWYVTTATGAIVAPFNTSQALEYKFNSTNAANAWFFTNGLNLTGGTSYRLTYRYGNSGTTTYIEKLRVNYGNSPLVAAMTNTLADHPNITTNNNSVTVDFVPATTGVYYIGFNVYSAIDRAYLDVDDITVDLTPTCFPVTAITTTNTTTNTTDLGWTAPVTGTPVNYIWEIRTGGAAGTGTTGLVSTGTVVAPATTVTATGLSATTAYSVYVRTDCGAGDFSTWTAVKTFTTPAACPATTTPTVTNISGYSAVATWTAGATETAWDVYYGPTPLTAPSATTVPTATVGTTPSYTLASLTPTTGYAVYVRANCGVGNTSTWSAVRNFTTTVSCPAPTTVVISAITPTSAVATWTAGAAETSWFVKYSSPTNTVVVSGTPSYTMAGLTPSTNYSVQVKGICGAADSSAYTTLKTFMTPCLPPNITGTTPGTRCGIGTVTVGATGDPGATLQWYTAPTGGTAVATGSVFTTPTITNTTNYYVTATGGLTTYSVGSPSTTGAQGTNTSGAYLIFDATTAFTLNSVVIYPAGSGAGTVVIALQNSAGTTLQTATISATGASSAVAQLATLNFNITPGTGYRLNYLSSTGGVTALYRESSGTTYPFTVPGVVSITGSSLAGGYYYYFYNWQLSTGCESARTAVAANVTAPPALALTATTTVCANVISTVSVTSTASNYNSYVWSPVTNLYTDAAATIPYAGTSATTLYYKSATAGSTTYNVNASNSVSGCASIASTMLSTSIPVVNASVSPSVVCSGAAVTLSATTNANTAGNKTVGTNSSADYTGGPYREGAATENKAQWLFTAAELTAAGLAPGNISGLAFNVTTVGSGAMNNFTIRMGATASTSLGATYDPTPASVVYGPVSYTAVAGANIHTFSSAFNWDGVSNVIVQVCHDLVSGSSSSVSRQSISNRTSYTNAAGACAGTVGTTVAYRPVMTFTGQVAGQGAGTYTWQWNPGALSGSTVTANPVNTGTNATTVSYTVSGTDPMTSCTNTAVVTVTVNPVPVAPVAHNSTQCGFGVPTASVTGLGGTYKWYAAPTSTTVLQSSTSATYTSAVNTSTTFYVSEFNGTCEGPRVAVSVTVTTPDALTASVNTSTICPGSAVTLSVTQTGSTNTYTYSWTASPVSGSGIPTSVSGSTAVITPTASGLFTYTVTGTDGSCNAISTITLNVVAPPVTPTVSPASPSVCAGSTATLVALGASATSSLIAENFEGGTLGSFSVVNLANHTSGTITQWAVRTSPYNGWTGATAINSGSSKFASTNNDAGSSGQKSNSCLLSGVVNTNGMTGLDLNFRHFFDYFNYQAPDSCYLEVTTNGTTWTTVKTYTADVATSTSFAAESVPLNAYVNQSTFQVRFRFRSGWNYGWCVDDIALVGTQTLPSVTYSWSPGTGLSATTGTMVTANPASTTVYTITADNGSCTSSNVFTLTVNPVPSVTVAASTGSICSGTTASLTATGATTYSWLPAGGTSSVAVVSPTATTVYTVTGSSLGCSNTKTVNLNVTATPTVVASVSPTVICAGATVSLTASGAATYNWMPNSSTSGTTTATPTVSTTYTVSGSTAGCTNTRTLNVTVNSVPTLTVTSNPSVLCTTGATATLTAVGTSTAYVWNTSATTASITVAPTATTVYSVTGTNSCGSKTMTTSITVATTPTIAAMSSETVTCPGNPAVLTASATPGVTFSWNTGPTTASITVTPTMTITYTVTATNACGSAAATVVQNVIPCNAINEVTNAGGISIYPNPANDYVNIAVPANLASANTTVEVTDALGKLVIKETINTDVTTLRITELKDGIYFFKVISNNQTVKVGKVVKH